MLEAMSVPDCGNPIEYTTEDTFPGVRFNSLNNTLAIDIESPIYEGLHKIKVTASMQDKDSKVDPIELTLMLKISVAKGFIADPVKMTKAVMLREAFMLSKNIMPTIGI
jgi:hypothetical protein